jgi:hypothetical protein
MKRMPDRGDQVISGARRVVIPPGRHRGACPVQVAGSVVAEPHSWPPVMIIFFLVSPAIAGITGSQDPAGA